MTQEEYDEIYWEVRAAEEEMHAAKNVPTPTTPVKWPFPTNQGN